jgi:hypothetical protein
MSLAEQIQGRNPEEVLMGEPGEAQIAILQKEPIWRSSNQRPTYFRGLRCLLGLIALSAQVINSSFLILRAAIRCALQGRLSDQATFGKLIHGRLLWFDLYLVGMKMAPTAEPFSSSPGDPWVMRVFIFYKQITMDGAHCWALDRLLSAFLKVS